MAFGAFGAGSAMASTAGILPPANPSADCDSSGSSVQFTLAALNVCRAKEGVGPLTLPSNWTSLTSSQQIFVLADLERVNRGLAPVVGLSASLDRLASAGAGAGDDPSFPSGGFVGGGGVWFSGGSSLASDYAWMYDDGPNGFDINADCPSTGGTDCWLHRDIVLWKGTGGALVAGAGVDGNSYAMEILSGYTTSDLVFTWAHELKYFATKPGVERVPTAEPARSTGKKTKKKKKVKKTTTSSTTSSNGGSITISVS